MRSALLATTLLVLIPLAGVSRADSADSPALLGTQGLDLGEILTIRSDVLKEERKVLIRLPGDYDATAPRKYPVLYVLDAEYHFQLAVAAVQFLSECGYTPDARPIPAMIVVGIVNRDRDRDYTPTHAPKHGRMRFPTSGKAAPFLEFLETELMPLVDARYRTHPFRILSGWSFGGLFTMHTFLTKPDLFGGYLAVSPSLWWDDQYVVQRADEILTDGRTIKKRLVVTLGTDEGGDMRSSVADSFVPLLSKKDLKGLVFQYLPIANEGHDFVPFKAFFDGLRALYSDWFPSDEVVSNGLPAVQEFYSHLSQETGCNVETPESVYNRLAIAVGKEGRVEAAVDIVKSAVKQYPGSVRAHALLGFGYYRLNMLEEAKDSFEKAYKLEKERALPYSDRLNAYRRRVHELQSKLDSGD
jgi:predicted alpha/beta superfamily hydrolase